MGIGNSRPLHGQGSMLVMGPGSVGVWKEGVAGAAALSSGVMLAATADSVVARSGRGALAGRSVAVICRLAGKPAGRGTIHASAARCRQNDASKAVAKRLIQACMNGK